MEEKIKGGSFHPLFSGEAQKKHRPRGSMSTKTVLSVRDQGLEPWTILKKPHKKEVCALPTHRCNHFVINIFLGGKNGRITTTL